ncbi:SDR family oxidoreductase [Corynebacterium sp. H113]|uniref:SDR family oxidoreductase n=1 Tax=Corynebacterium sp. H113 TaxID=3133419 RepID=UPI0030B55B78
MAGIDLSSEVVLITGGTRGIGYATALEFSRGGAKVALTSRSQESATEMAHKIAHETGGKVIGIGAHVADVGAARDACSRVAEELGPLTVLVNNAGTNPAYGPIIDQPLAAMEKTFLVNTLAPSIWTRAAVASGLGSSPSAIINVSSVGALTIEEGLGTYNASKAALLHMTRQLAMELAPAIRVNSISPGVVRTKLSEALWKDQEEAVSSVTPLRRIGEPEDIAKVICFLASGAASWMTGDNLVIDGGLLVRNPMEGA